MAKKRLDVLLCEKGFFDSRERAKAVIMAGQVYVNGQKSDKAGVNIDENAQIQVRGDTLKYVSRGGLKLEKALDFFGGSPEGKTCIDCGASTGGFTDVMLRRGAGHVYAVDVGYGQLAWSLRNDPRVTVMERTNVRYLEKDMFPVQPDFATIDVSFISLSLIFPALKRILVPGSEIFSLIKPQFEAGREKVGKKGVVREAATHEEVIEKAFSYARENGFSVLGLTWSPIRGPEGNIEFLGHFVVREGEDRPVSVRDVVNEAHERLEQQ